MASSSSHKQHRQKRSEMTPERLALERERARKRYKQRIDNMSHEQLAMYREHQKNYQRCYRERRTYSRSSSSAQPTSSFHSATETDFLTRHEVLQRIQSYAQSEVARISGIPSNVDISINNGALNISTDNDPINSNNAREILLDSTPIVNDIYNQWDLDSEDHNVALETGLQDEVLPTENTSTARRRRMPTSQRSYHNCARNFVDCPQFQQFQLGPFSICRHCHAKLFPGESKNTCCLNGRLTFPLIDTPPELMQLYTANSTEGIHFRQNIRAYNHVFAFTSMGVHIDDALANAMDGVYTYRAQGAIYHKIGSLLPPNGIRPRYMQMYVFDTDHEIEHRMEENNLVNREVLAILKQILDTYNPYVQVLKQISQHEDMLNIRLHIKELPPNERQYNMPTSSQVAAILVGEDDPIDRNDRDIIIQTVGGDLLNVPDTAGFYDPLQYPLLHPRGNFGWDLNISNSYLHNVSCRQYYCYLLQIRSNHDSVFLRGGRLLQQYVVDNYVKIASQRLRYLRDHQSKLRTELYQTLHHSVLSGETNSANIGRRTILPASYIGSPRDMHNLDAMALVQKFGKPYLFLTMTCNPNWDEITDNLFPGQTPSDRPDLTTRVFRAKCEELKKDLFNKSVLGKAAAYVHVIEFQKRGLPHAHMLIIFDRDDKLDSPLRYDQIVRADIPDPAVEPDLYNVVIRHMIHGPCGTLNPRSVCMRNNRCKKFFPKQFSSATVQGNDSYPIYKRPENGHYFINSRGIRVDNSWVVPYNPWLLRKYNCHLNVEVCSTIKCVKYLYKYLYKGPDRVSMEVRSAEHPGRDEIQQFIDARWVCPQESVWRIFKFPLNKMYPSVYALDVHVPNMHELLFSEDQSVVDLVEDASASKTMLTEFFTKNSTDLAAQQYLYREFPEHYVWSESNKCWEKRRGLQRVIGRLHPASPSDGEKFYVRMLLNHKRGPISFDDLKTVNSVLHNTFKEAAEYMGLLERDTAIFDCLTEAAISHMPCALRGLFASILVFCNPAGVRRLWDEFWEYMIEDYPSSSSSAHASNCLLMDLNSILSVHEKSISDYDLPAITNDSSNQSDMLDFIAMERSIVVSPEDLQSIDYLNEAQKIAFDRIIRSIEQQECILYFVDGPGGTGKTFLYRAILAYVRSKGQIAIATATSGLAATMIPGGRTTHSRFKIPVPTLSTSTCKIGKRSNLAQLLREASVILWDEATMCHRFAFECLDRSLQDITDIHLTFGGKVFVLGGDFRQVLPIVRHSTISQTISACITSSSLWKAVHILKLTENMRARTDLSFSEYLLCVGDGLQPCILDDMVKLPSDMIIPWEGSDPLSNLISTIFPSLEDNAFDRNYVIQRAIITTTNEHADSVNNKIVNCFPGEEYIYYSFDSVEDDDGHVYQQDYLNSLCPNGLPPHKLILKVGAPIILMRNVNPSAGLCNGTRLVCRWFKENVICAEILTGQFYGKPTFIHRIPLKASQDTDLPFSLIRRQFPIRLSFALTINKSQGQTIPHVGIYLPDYVFSHGQLYVALSRGVSKNNTKILVNGGVFEGFPGIYTRNVVYREVLQSSNSQST